MRILSVFLGMLLFVLAQMSSFEVNAHHSVHISNVRSHEVLATVKPMTMVADTLRFCTQMGNAELPPSNQVYLGEGHPDASSCSAHIWSTQTIADACGGNVTYDVRLYVNDGIDFIQVVASTTVPLDLNQQAVLNFDTRSSSLATDHEISLYGVPYTSGLCTPVNGHHRLIWTVVNDCDETTVFESLLKLEDCRNPVPICVGLSSVVVPSIASVTIWAKDFDNGSSVDDCTGHDNLMFSFSGTDYQPSRVFSCGELCSGSNGSPSHLIEIWMADGGVDSDCDGEISWSERNKDFCTTFIVFDDNEDVCNCFTSTNGGRVRTPLGAGIIGVTVNLYSPFGELIDQATTNQLGYYEFPMVIINPLVDYTYEPIRDDNHKIGVSTLDLIQIQKHLLGITPFDSPFEVIAADANYSESVSALDLVEIRKLILGHITEFGGPSWRFVSENHQFGNPLAPWPFSETVTASGMTSPNFIGVKVGDIHSANRLTTIEVRNAPEMLSLYIEDQHVVLNQEWEMPVYSNDVSDLLGLQLTMSTQGLEYVGVIPGMMNLTTDCIASHPDAITLSWANLSPVSTNRQQPLFTLRFTAKADGRLHEMIDLNSSITKSEAYREAGIIGTGLEEIEVLNVQLLFGTSNFEGESNRYQLDQNVPNPFSDQTVIGFNLPSAMTATLGIFNAFGQEIYRITNDFKPGLNSVTIRNDVFNGPGIFCYYLKTQDFTAGKMLILNE